MPGICNFGHVTRSMDRVHVMVIMLPVIGLMIETKRLRGVLRGWVVGQEAILRSEEADS